MFQPAIAFTERIDHEDVAIDRTRPAKEPQVVLAQLLEIACEPCHVRLMTSGDRDPMRHAVGGEPRLGERPQFHRMIDQLVVVGGAVQTEPARIKLDRRHRSDRAPAPIRGPDRRAQQHRRRLVFAAEYARKQAGAVEETALGVEPGATHRQIVREDASGHDQRRGGTRASRGLR